MKRAIIILLLLTLTVAMVEPESTKADTIKSVATENEQIEEQIYAMKADVLSSVYSQLENQNATYMYETYEEILTPQIESYIYEINGMDSIETEPLNPISASVSGKHTYTLTYGGEITYLIPVSGAEATQVSVTCMDYNNSYHYVLTQNSFKAKTIITNIMGYIPDLGYVTSAILNLSSYRTAAANTSILNAGGYAEIINTYNPEYESWVSAVVGWSSHTKFTTPSSATNIKKTAFSYHNPWN